MFRKRSVLLSVILIIFGVFSLYNLVWQQEEGAENQKNADSTAQETSSTSANEEAGKNNEISKGPSKISFEKYKHLYKDMKVDTAVNFDRRDCVKRKSDKKLKYAFFEFILLEKRDNGKLVPFKTTRIRYKNITMFKKHQKALDRGKRHPECEVGYVGPMPVDKASRIKVSIIKNCKCLAHAFKPGNVYKILKIMGFGKVEHKFQVPAEDKINFVSSGSGNEPETIRFPILVNDLNKRREEQKEEKRPERKTLTVKNIFPDVYSNKKWKTISGNIDLVYHAPGDGASKEINGSTQTHTFQLRPGDNGKITGGDLSLHMLKKISDPDKPDEIRFYLLQHKAKVSSRTVNFSDQPDYVYTPDQNVEKTITLGDINQKLKEKYNLQIEVKTSDRVIWLKKDFGGMEPESIYAAKPRKEEGTLKVIIDAQPGKYQLYYGNKLIEKSFNWPPGNAEEGAGTGKPGDK